MNFVVNRRMIYLSASLALAAGCSSDSRPVRGLFEFECTCVSHNLVTMESSTSIGYVCATSSDEAAGISQCSKWCPGSSTRLEGSERVECKLGFNGYTPALRPTAGSLVRPDKCGDLQLDTPYTGILKKTDSEDRTAMTAGLHRVGGGELVARADISGFHTNLCNLEIDLPALTREFAVNEAISDHILDGAFRVDDGGGGWVRVHVNSVEDGATPCVDVHVEIDPDSWICGTSTFAGQLCAQSVCGVEPPPDIDGDGVSDPADNCPLHPNTDQKNIDGDPHGDVCDDDRDGDGCLNGKDEAPAEHQVVIGSLTYTECDNLTLSTVMPASLDLDGDKLPNCADPDDDGDGLLDKNDPCPGNPMSKDCHKTSAANVCPKPERQQLQRCVGTGCFERIDDQLEVTRPLDQVIRTDLPLVRPVDQVRQPIEVSRQ